MIYILDVSYWNEPNDVPWQLLWDLGFRLVIIKASMGGGIDRRCDRHVALAKEHGFDVGLYHWVDPTQSWSGQFVHFRGQIYKHEPQVVAFDVEQWWADWDKWYKSIRGEIPNSQVPRNSAARMVASYESVRSRTVAEFDGVIPVARMWTYSADWVTDMFAGLAEAMEGHELWVADYSYSRTIVHSEFDGDFKLTPGEWEMWSRYMQDELVDDYDGTPLLPGNLRELIAWQGDSKVVPPGSPRGYDISFFKGTPEDYEVLMDRAIEPDPEPDPDPDPDPDPISEIVVEYSVEPASVSIDFQEA